MSSSAEERREHLRRRYFGISEWPQELDLLLESAPDLLEAYLRLSAIPWGSGELSPRVKHLVYIAADAVPLQFYPPGLRMHASAARHLGAPQEDIDAVVAIAGLVSFEAVIEGIHAVVAEDSAETAGDGPDGAAGAELRRRFVAVRGAWDERLEPVLRNAELARAWVDIVEATWAMPANLSPAEREVVLASALAAGGYPAAAMAFPMSRAMAGGLGVGAIHHAVCLIAPLGMHAIANALARVREP